jgi:hypothetical protein
MDQPPVPEIEPYVNRNLFSQHFLKELLPQDEAWQVDEDKLKLAMQAAANLYAGREEEWARSNESQLEDKLVRPMLGKLEHRFEVQTSLPTVEGRRWPDYAFFATDEDRREALDFAGAEAYFSKAIGIGDAKRWGQPLDRLQGARGDKFDRLNPSWQIDYYLRMSGTRWAILTNGRLWRLYSRETSFRLDTYYEIDLVRMLAAQDLEVFKYFYLFFRRHAFEPDAGGLCFLDQVYQGSLKYARAVGDDLKENVYKALRLLADGFLRTSGNDLDPARDLEEIYANSLVLLYRLLFINYAEDRGLLPRDDRSYRDDYGLVSIEGIIADKLDRRESLPQLKATYWETLTVLFKLINEGSESSRLAKQMPYVPPYNGGLFDPKKHPFLEKNKVADYWLARVIDLLARSQGQGTRKGRVDYCSLDVRHLGSIYEGLLEYKLRVAEEEMVAVKRRGKEQWISSSEAGSSRVLDRVEPGSIYLATDRGERKATGSYYTPDYIVKYIVEHTVGPLIHEKMKGENPIEGILSLKVLDPAMGSGHFLVEATDRLAHALVEALGVAEKEPEEEDIRWARREVVERCIYGVDLNPLAMELAKLSLWLHTVAEGKPLNFLDHHLKVGNSLIGAWVDDLASLPVSQKRGSVKDAEREVQQLNLFQTRLEERLPVMLDKVLEIIRRRSDTLDDIKAKAAADQAVEELKAPFKAVAHVWVSTHFGNEVTHEQYQRALERIGEPQELIALPWVEQATDTARTNGFFHWELEFPEAFYHDSKKRDDPGFDAVVGNPPYGYRTMTDFKPLLEHRGQLPPSENVAETFIQVACELTQRGGSIGMIVPKQLTYTPTWGRIRRYLRRRRGPPTLLVDATEAFEGVLLEQVIFVVGSPAQTAEGVTVGLVDRARAQITHVGTVPAEEVSDRIWAIHAVEESGRLGAKVDAISTPLGEICEVYHGLKNVRPMMNYREGEEILRGDNIARSACNDDILRLPSEHITQSDRSRHCREKIVFQQVVAHVTRPVPHIILMGSIDRDQRLIFETLNTFVTRPHVRYRLPYLLAIMNSRLYAWHVHRYTFNLAVRTMMFRSGYVEFTPIRRIAFMAPEERATPMMDDYAALPDDAFREPTSGLRYRPFLSSALGRWVAGCLEKEPEQSDLVHDMLSDLSERMIQMNKQKHAEAKGFLDWLGSHTRVPMEEWRLKSIAQSYWEHGWDAMVRALCENRKAIEKASGRNVESRDAQEAIRREFEKSMAKLSPMVERIASTDRLIDLIVYRLYGLTEEEVAVVEGTTAE